MKRLSGSLRPFKTPICGAFLRCALLAHLPICDMSAFAALLRLELHPHLEVLQRSQPV
ncbi:Trk system potassium uptake protein TrkH [Neisseria shayeganii 871]|uniref:Trk system potassium uptake protein TrkH n=1 Tax=Neisseria shayeganii 871 TaxID=1032488 RepID=G4CHP9_9NEIS|nr:Trk system potassium uptake protein TrkH [Neisseria shayeganii 871]